MWNIIFQHLFKTMYTERMSEAVKMRSTAFVAVSRKIVIVINRIIGS